MMKLLDLTFESPEANLACEEALLESFDDGSIGNAEGLLRFWEPANYFVVLGYANKVAREVNVDACARQGIPILRRCSGGGTVVQGTGVFNYSVILPVTESGPLSGIAGTNGFVMERHRKALEELTGKPVALQGHTDLTIGGVKFSGNAQRRKRRFLLFHGTFLLHMNLDLVEEVLQMPSQQPEYRAFRRHVDFVTNLAISGEALKSQLIRSWDVADTLDPLPWKRIEELSKGKYASEEWNLRF